MAISDIPGYFQGFIFSDDSASTYDAGYFIDQAGYGLGNSIEITVGTPTYVTQNGHKGIRLDNSCQGRFIFACPWEVCAITVMRPNITSNISLYPMIFNTNSVASAGLLRLQRASGPVYRHTLGKSTGATAAVCQQSDNGVHVSAFDISQVDRIFRSSLDGVSVTAGSPVADPGDGNSLSLAFYGAFPNPTGIYSRFGNTQGTDGNTTPLANTADLFEVHFFQRGLLTTYLTEAAAEMAALETKYGI